MKILDARIDWMFGWANTPIMRLLVDKMPDHSQLRYKCYGEGPNHTGLYFAQLDGYVDFFYSTDDKTGFGGRVFTPTMEDGTARRIRGPWSSNYMAAKRLTGVDCVDVSITDDPAVWERGHTFYHANVTYDKLLEACILISKTGRNGLITTKPIDGDLGRWIVVPTHHPEGYISFAVRSGGSWVTKQNEDMEFRVDKEAYLQIHKAVYS